MLNCSSSRNCRSSSFLHRGFIMFLHEQRRCMKVWRFLRYVIPNLILNLRSHLTCPPQWCPWGSGSSRRSRRPGHPRLWRLGGWHPEQFSSSSLERCPSPHRWGASPGRPVQQHKEITENYVKLQRHTATKHISYKPAPLHSRSSTAWTRWTI